MTRNLNMFTLIGIGVGVAYIYSIVAALFPGIFPVSFRKDGEVGVYFEAAAVIVTLVLLGQVLELKAYAVRQAQPLNCSSVSPLRQQGA